MHLKDPHLLSQIHLPLCTLYWLSSMSILTGGDGADLLKQSPSLKAVSIPAGLH